MGAVRLSSDVGLVVGPAAAGVLADSAGVQAPFAVLGALALVAMTVCLIGRWTRFAALHGSRGWPASE